jgi:hypothetical protein
MICEAPVQPLPDLREGCIPWNFMQVEFYVSHTQLWVLNLIEAKKT